VDSRFFSGRRDRNEARALLRDVLPPSIQRETNVALTLGQATRAKGYIDLLDAWREVRPTAPTWQLIMGGANAELDMQAEIAERGLSDSAHWIGLQPSARVFDLLRASDAFVLPSHNEGLSLSVLEAMAMGLPTIATNVGGHAELIRDAREGWLIPAQSVAALTRALRQLTESESARRECGEGGRRAAQRIGTTTGNARRLLTVLRSTVEQHRPERGASRAFVQPTGILS
jgi:glycosyltransferase involved in cell wall biosynthesis